MVFVKCTKKNHSVVFLGSCSIVSGCFFFFLGKNINRVNAKLVDTVLNLCTLKCVLCLYSCKYSENYKRYLKMIIKYIDLVNYNVAMELDVGYKVVVVLFGILFFHFFIFLGVCGLGARLIVRFLFVVFHSTCDRSPGCSGATVAPPSSPRCAHIWNILWSRQSRASASVLFAASSAAFTSISAFF